MEVSPSAATLGVLLWLTSGTPIADHLASPPVRLPNADSSQSLADALSNAARTDQLDRVKQLVAAGADVNARDRVGSTPLHAVAWSGNIEIANFLLSHGSDVNALQSNTGSTALGYAVLSDKAAMVKLLLAAGARLNIRDSSGETAVHVAAVRGSPQVLDALLASHPDIDATDGKNNTALDEAVLHGRTRNVEVLLAHGANASRVHSLDGRGPFHEACIKGFAELIEPLLAAGADPVQRDRSGQSPLDLALAYKNVRVVAVLLRLGTRLEKLEAVAEDAMESATLRGQTEIASLLIQGGFDINRPTATGSTYLHRAALKGQVKMVQLLLDRGAQVNVLDRSGGTPLHDAALGGDTEVINLLLSRGAKIDVKERESGATALMLAASIGRTDAVALLLERGANPALKDHEGHTALDRAKESDDEAIVKLLETSLGRSKVALSTKTHG